MKRKVLLIYSLIIYAACCSYAQTASIVSDSIAQLSVGELKQLAKAQHPTAQHRLAQLYEDVQYEKHNIRRSVKYYEAAAMQNYPPALYDLGRIYEKGIGVVKDTRIAANYYKLAVQKDNINALLSLASLHERGEGIAEDQQESIRLYLKAWRLGESQAFQSLSKISTDNYKNKPHPDYLYYLASKGDAESQYQVGLMYEKGTKEFPIDIQKSLTFYRKASYQDHTLAQYKVGRAYEQNNQLEKAVPYLLKAANKGYRPADSILSRYDLYQLADTTQVDFLIYRSKSGEASKQFALYEKYMFGKDTRIDHEKALTYCRQAASNKHERAMMVLAGIYEKGIIAKADPEKSFYWYHEAALLGNDNARYNVAEMYTLGKGITQNIARAIRWYLKAANNGLKAAQLRLNSYDISRYVESNSLDYIRHRAIQGETDAQFQLGEHLYETQNSRALVWLKKAALKGVVAAQLLLGDIYRYGHLHTLRDLKQAVEWYGQAAENGDLKALESLIFVYAEPSTYKNQEYVQKTIAWGRQYIKQSKNNETFNPIIYFLLAKSAFQLQDYTQSKNYYIQFINQFDQASKDPLKLLDAFYNLSCCYYLLSRDEDCANNAEIALLNLEELKTAISDTQKYENYRGRYQYMFGQAWFNIGNIFKACNNFQMAKKNGISIEKKYVEACLKH